MATPQLVTPVMPFESAEIGRLLCEQLIDTRVLLVLPRGLYQAHRPGIERLAQLFSRGEGSVPLLRSALLTRFGKLALTCFCLTGFFGLVALSFGFAPRRVSFALRHLSPVALATGNDRQRRADGQSKQHGSGD